jgi:hypothetical protein
MPSSIDTQANTPDTNTPMGFRRDRNWFLSFLMTPFKDIDQRATEDNLARQSTRRGRQ